MLGCNFSEPEVDDSVLIVALMSWVGFTCESGAEACLIYMW